MTPNGNRIEEKGFLTVQVSTLISPQPKFFYILSQHMEKFAQILAQSPVAIMFERIFSSRTPAYSPLAPRSSADPPSEKHEREACEGSVDDDYIIPRHQKRSVWPTITFHVVLLAINAILLMVSMSNIARVQSSSIHHSPSKLTPPSGLKSDRDIKLRPTL